MEVKLRQESPEQRGPTCNVVPSRRYGGDAADDSATGSVHCVYCCVHTRAECADVAQDHLRNHAATIIIMCCESDDVTHRVAHEFQTAPIDNRPLVKGKGQKGSTRVIAADFQVSYVCTSSHNLAVAGWRDLVREVCSLEERSTERGGMMLITDVGFSVAHFGTLQFRVAVSAAYAQGRAVNCVFSNAPGELSLIHISEPTRPY